MSLKFWTKVLLASVTALAVAAADARADLTVRVSSFDSSNNLTASTSFTTVGNPPYSGASAGNGSAFSVDAFSFGIGGVSLTATSPTGTGTTSHSMTINISNYTGPTGASSNKLLVEFLGTGYTLPAGSSQVTANGSPSTSGLAATTVTLVSSVSTTNAGLSATPTFPATTPTGAAGTASASGSMGGASSVLTPNPTNGAIFSHGTYSFYQAISFSGFTNNNQSGSLSAGSAVVAVPEPMTLISAFVGLSSLGMYRLRRRKAVEA